MNEFFNRDSKIRRKLWKWGFVVILWSQLFGSRPYEDEDSPHHFRKNLVANSTTNHIVVQ